MKDRIPRYAGRIRLTPVQGEQGVYDTERADEPLQNGTPLNKSTLLSGEVENQLGLDENSTPSDAFLKLILLLSELKTFVHDILDSDDETLDELSEIVSYIKNNRDFIQEITDGKVSVSDIVNDLTTNDAKKPLSAAQGYLLQKNKANKSDRMTPTAHNQSASTITAGTFGGQVVANATAVATVGTAQVRNIYAGTSDMTAGSTALTTGVVYFVYE